MARFLHTADWQLGMVRAFLPVEAQARFDEARIDAVRALGRLAEAEGCDFVVVCGDVFEHAQIGAKAAGRSMRALKALPVPVYLLPGNHDPLNAGSVYRSRWFTTERPEQVTVLDAPGLVRISAEVELLVAPWYSKQPPVPQLDLMATQLEPAAPGTVRIGVGHGATEDVAGDMTGTALRIGRFTDALNRRALDYVALGDHHSLRDVGDLGKIWYPGTPEPTRFTESAPGYVLVVDLEPDIPPKVTPHRVGRWTLAEREWELHEREDAAALLAWLDAFPDETRTVAKPIMSGLLSLTDHAYLADGLDVRRDLFAAIPDSSRSRLAIRAVDADLDGLDLTGFAAEAAADLRSQGTPAALDALELLLRLTALQSQSVIAPREAVA
jgi:DNA repair exonuclease SbcCD nuclease subunit